VGVGLMYGQGFFTSKLVKTAGRKPSITNLILKTCLPYRVLADDGSRMTVEYRIPRAERHTGLVGNPRGRVPLYLLDSNIDPIRKTIKT